MKNLYTLFFIALLQGAIIISSEFNVRFDCASREVVGENLSKLAEFGVQNAIMQLAVVANDFSNDSHHDIIKCFAKLKTQVAYYQQVSGTSYHLILTDSQTQNIFKMLESK